MARPSSDGLWRCSNCGDGARTEEFGETGEWVRSDRKDDPGMFHCCRMKYSAAKGGYHPCRWFGSGDGMPEPKAAPLSDVNDDGFVTAGYFPDPKCETDRILWEEFQEKLKDRRARFMVSSVAPAEPKLPTADDLWRSRSVTVHSALEMWRNGMFPTFEQALIFLVFQLDQEADKLRDALHLALAEQRTVYIKDKE